MAFWGKTLFGLVLSVLPAATAGAQASGGELCTLSTFDSFLARLSTAEDKITVTVSPDKSEWHLGDEARFTVTSPIAGKLVLFSVAPPWKGAPAKVYPIYPNPYMTDTDEGTIQAGTSRSFPADEAYGFEVLEPLGPSRLVAIVYPENRTLPLECAHALTRGTVIDLPDEDNAVPPPRLSPATPPGWAYAEFHYLVVAGMEQASDPGR